MSLEQMSKDREQVTEDIRQKTETRKLLMLCYSPRNPKLATCDKQSGLQCFFFSAHFRAPLYELIAICGLQCYILYLCSPQDTDRHLYTCRSESPNFAKKISLSLDGLVVYFKDEITDL